jgi:hypothetical protein
LTVVFENRQTLWFRLQELLRVARVSEPVLVQQELDLYNRLLPGRGQLQAAFLIEVADESRLTEELAFWKSLEGPELRLCLGDRSFPATLDTCRPEDRAMGAAHWIRFLVDEEGRQRLSTPRQAAYLEVGHGPYQYQSNSLSEDVRQSLLDDLELSERDGDLG